MATTLLSVTNDNEICSALYFVLRVGVNKQRHSSSSWRGHSREQQLKWMQSRRSSVWPRETSARQRHYHTRLLAVGASEYEAAQDSCSSSDFCTMKSCRCQTAYIGEQRAVVGAGTIWEQATSEWTHGRVLSRDYSMCIPTYHVHKNYITYTVATWPLFSWLRQFRRVICVAMSSLGFTSSRWILRSRGNTDVRWLRAEMLEVSSY